MSSSRPLSLVSACLLLLSPAAQAQEAAAEVDEGEEEIVVQATRSGRTVQDEAIRVDVIGREEIEEKMLMTPGNISMLVAETPGVRVQVTSPGLGTSNVRMQGMSGRYTQLLSDGLPIYGGTSSIGLLQIPPTDLGQVEVIKGAASALYGPSALAGVINLVSRRPKAEPEAEMLINATSRDGQDITAYAATPIGGDWSASVTGGFHHQTRKDLDGDGWADMAHYDRWTVRPRLFWDRGDGAKALVTLGLMDERRRGGTIPGAAVPDGTAFPLNQDSRRIDGGIVTELPVEGVGTLQFRASGTSQKHDHLYGPSREDDRHDTLFAELSLGGEAGDTTWLAGAAVQGDRYRNKSFSSFDYRYTVPALFVQAEQEIGDLLVLAGSARLDDHSDFGMRLSPRLSLLFRPDRWTVRASVGRGFYAPTPFVDAIDEAGLSRLEPLGPLKAEVADTASLDIGYAKGPFETNLTLFGSDIDNSLQLVDVATDRVRLVNAAGVTRTRGAEMTARYRWNDFIVRGSYVFVDAREPDPSGVGRRRVPQTPKHTAGLVAMWEQHGKGRIGLEAYYTGRQQLDDNPYRTRSKRYVELGALGEVTLGKVSLFINLENILNVRQTRYNPILLPARAPDGRWTTDAWAPTDGFVANGGVRLRFGG